MNETKICTKCKQELPITEFRWKNKAENRKHSQCKTCQKAQEKIHYRESKERQINVRDTADQQKQTNLSIIALFKGQGCCKCGETRIYVLDCHHIKDSGKIDTINHMAKSASPETLRAELNKCVCLCANCHREFHYLETLNELTLEDYLR